MKHMPILLSACLLTTSAIALESGQSASPSSESPPSSSEPAKETGAKGTDTKSAPTPQGPAAKAEPKAAPERKTTDLSPQAYMRILAAEIRKHTPKSAPRHAGSVKVNFTIGGGGRVVSHTVQQSSDPALTEIATKVLASIHTPPPPGGKFSAVQQFNFR